VPPPGVPVVFPLPCGLGMRGGGFSCILHFVLLSWHLIWQGIITTSGFQQCVYGNCASFLLHCVFCFILEEGRKYKYKVVQIWPGQTVTCLHTNSPSHIWTTL
jgi:hypothetical protein